jgi:thiamine biosynthesis lipoprotein
MNAHCRVVEAPFRLRRAEVWLGTLVAITACAHTEAQAVDGIRAAFAVIAAIHKALSGHESDSELTRINRNAARSKQAISPDLRAVVECALHVAARSAGVFDPTIGGELVALGFLPRIGACDRRTTWRDVVVDDEGLSFKRTLVLDLDGIAKGYAVDRASDALRGAGVVQAVVNAGGDLRVHGPAAETVDVRTGGAQSARLPLIAIADGAVATSAYGDRRRRIGGRVTTPLIDPRTRLPSMTTRTVSVAAPNCMLADALTKVVALQGARAEGVLAFYGASAAILSPSQGRWRCTRLPR